MCCGLFFLGQLGAVGGFLVRMPSICFINVYVKFSEWIATSFKSLIRVQGIGYVLYIHVSGGVIVACLLLSHRQGRGGHPKLPIVIRVSLVQPAFTLCFVISNPHSRSALFLFVSNPHSRSALFLLLRGFFVCLTSFGLFGQGEIVLPPS